jgi:hypothetical protein
MIVDYDPKENPNNVNIGDYVSTSRTQGYVAEIQRNKVWGFLQVKLKDKRGFDAFEEITKCQVLLKASK